MRKLFVLPTLFFVFASIQLTFAQEFDANNFISKLALVYYEKDGKGFYQKKENIVLKDMPSFVSIYGYNKKTHELYVETEFANCVVTVSDDYHKRLKKKKDIPQLNQQELDAKVIIVNNQLMNKIALLNNARQQFINDSIEQERIETIRKAREDSLRMVAERNKAEDYMKNHKWYDVPLKNKVLFCEICEEAINSREGLLCYKLKNDTIFWGEMKTGRLGLEYEHIHVAKIPWVYYTDKDFGYHYEVFSDSLENNLPSLNYNVAVGLNVNSLDKYMAQLKKEAPNGLILNWDWGIEYSNITFNFRYMNTNKNTIKYIEVFWTVRNDVGDVRKTGSFKGTGPLEEWESASWNWGHSSYCVSGDATKMNLTKIIITYMNGSKVTIPKDKIKYDY